MAEPERAVQGAGLVSAADWLKRAGSKVAEAAGNAAEAVREGSNSAGAAPLHAAFRLGLKELQDNIGVMTPGPGRDEPGSIANPTSQLVTEQMTGNEVDPQKDTISAPMSDADIKKSVYGNMPVQPAKENEHQHQREGRGGR